MRGTACCGRSVSTLTDPIVAGRSGAAARVILPPRGGPDFGEHFCGFSGRRASAAISVKSSPGCSSRNRNRNEGRCLRPEGVSHVEQFDQFIVRHADQPFRLSADSRRRRRSGHGLHGFRKCPARHWALIARCVTPGRGTRGRATGPRHSSYSGLMTMPVASFGKK